MLIHWPTIICVLTISHIPNLVAIGVGRQWKPNPKTLNMNYSLGLRVIVFIKAVLIGRFFHWQCKKIVASLRKHCIDVQANEWIWDIYEALVKHSCTAGLDKMGSRECQGHGRDMGLAGLFEIREGSSGSITENDKWRHTKSQQRETGRENQAEIKSLTWLSTITDWVAKENLILHFVILSADFIGPAKKIATLPLSG